LIIIHEIFKCCGEEFNINSTAAASEILFDKLGFATGRKTKTGFSTDASHLKFCVVSMK
jgi:DNA polymerase I